MSEVTDTTPVTPESTQTVEINAEVVEKFLGTPEGQKMLQPRFDSYFSKGLQTWQEKNIDKIKETERETIKTEMQQRIDELSTSLTANRINSELKLKLLSEGADKDDVDLLMRAVDISKVTIDNDKMIGLNDVVNNLKESRPKWFSSQLPPPPPAKGRDTIPQGNQPPASKQGKLTRAELDTMNSQDRIMYKKNNKDWDNYL